MGCFIVPAVGAVVAHGAKKHVEKHEASSKTRIPFSRKIGWLAKLLAGGSVLLAFEHVWHGEFVLAFPFLRGEDVLGEMATVGVAMLLLCLVIWAGMLAVTRAVESQAALAEKLNP